MPWLHQVHHAVEIFSDSHAPLHHEHPDYDAVNDNSLHLNDHDLSCVLCSLSVWHGVFNVEQASVPDASDAHIEVFVSARFLSNASISIRGPPLNMIV